MKKIFQLLIIISLGLFMNSCYYDSYPIYDDIDDGTGGGGEVPTEVSYSMNIQPLLTDVLDAIKEQIQNQI